MYRTFDIFWHGIQKNVHNHPVITRNPYCKWFKQGEISHNQMVNLFEQFAVFSKWFLLAQLMRVLHASDIEAETHARFILANELGVGINPDGSTENQPFKTPWAHINWLRETAKPLKLNTQILGNWETASPSTRHFIGSLEKTYGSKDAEISRGASYAIETWAAWGIGKGEEHESNNFWKELITGIERYNETNHLNGNRAIPLDFFLFHFNSEKRHGDNVLDEMKTSFHSPRFNAQKFFKGAHQALEAIYTFWLGLDKTRKAIGKKSAA